MPTLDILTMYAITIAHSHMWVQRTPEEIAKWQRAAENEARSHGHLIGGVVWILVAASSAGGWFFLLER